MSNLYCIYLNLNLLKKYQIPNYSIENLSKEIIEYSVLDTVFSKKIEKKLLSKEIIIKNKKSIIPRNLRKGNKVRVFLSRKVVGEGMVEFVSYKNCSEN